MAPARKTPEAPVSALSVPAFDASGRAAGAVELSETLFGTTPNQAVMHQAYLRQLANARQGTAKTKHRGEVRGGGVKPYRQKGTGRARHGSTTEPSMVGGGNVFGPQPRDYGQRMPRKMRRLALRSALSVKAAGGAVRVIDGFQVGDVPSTSSMVEVLRAVGAENSVLILLPAPNDIVQRSANNLPWAKVVLARNLNLYDLFTHDLLVITRDALELLEENFA